MPLFQSHWCCIKFKMMLGKTSLKMVSQEVVQTEFSVVHGLTRMHGLTRNEDTAKKSVKSCRVPNWKKESLQQKQSMTDIQTEGQSDPYVSLYFAGATKKVNYTWFLCLNNKIHWSEEIRKISWSFDIFLTVLFTLVFINQKNEYLRIITISSAKQSQFSQPMPFRNFFVPIRFNYFQGGSDLWPAKAHCRSMAV